MSGRTQFWLGSVMLAVAIGLLVGGLVGPRPSYSQEAGGGGEGRSGNYALVASSLPGIRAKSQVVYLIDDRNEAMFVIETVSSKSSKTEIRDFVDLRKLAEGLQRKRADEERKDEKRRPRP